MPEPFEEGGELARQAIEIVTGFDGSAPGIRDVRPAFGVLCDVQNRFPERIGIPLLDEPPVHVVSNELGDPAVAAGNDR
jgi:hypothetical protein